MNGLAVLYCLFAVCQTIFVAMALQF